MIINVPTERMTAHTINYLVRILFRSIFLLMLIFVCMHFTAHEARAQYGLDVAGDTLTSTVLIHPPIKVPPRGVLFTREHTYRPSGATLGDQLARDFIIMSVDENRIMRPFKQETDGEENTDWYSWRQDVLAPFDGKVIHVEQADSTNTSGKLNKEAQHEEIRFTSEEGTDVLYVHLREIKVKEGQQVKAGEVLAKVGNNGSSIAPHVHVGAWKEDVPLQIQVDLVANQRLKNKAGKN